MADIYVDDFLEPGDPPLDQLPHPAVARAVAEAARRGGGVVRLGKRPKKESDDD